MKEINPIPIGDFIILFLKDNPMKIPSVRFWAMTFLLVKAGIKIQMKDGHILTPKDCYSEMEDCASGDCFKLDDRGRFVLWLYQKKVFFGW